MSVSILIIHTDPASAEQFSVALDGIGLRSTVIDHPDVAYSAARIDRPDLILLEGQLVLEDPAICRKLRLTLPDKRLSIILLLPPEPGDVGRYLCGTDVDDYINHPYSLNELEARLMLRMSAIDKIVSKPFPQIDFAFLNSLSGMALSNIDNAEILQQAVSSVAKFINVNRCSVTLIREQGDNAYVMASSDDPKVNGLHVDLNRYPEIQETVSSGHPFIVDDVFKHPILQDVRHHMEGLAFNSILVLPMIDRDKTIGVLMLRSARPISGFSDEEIFFCQLVANVATSALRLAEVSALEAKQNDHQNFVNDQPQTAMLPQENFSLLDMAAHDLRVLVSVIDGYCTLFSESTNGKLQPEQAQIIDGLMAGNRRLVDMANDLLDFSQLNAGCFELNLAEQDISQIIGSVCNELNPLVRRRNISIDTECLNREVMAKCDEQGVRRVFYNIVNNALKFTPEGGTIKLDLDQVDGEAKVSVEDSGPGIEPRHLSTLFDEYTTVSPVDPRAGNGLGLSICKKIVEAHHGRIWAESCLGQGSRFTFCIPN